MSAARQVACPGCGKPVAYDRDNAWRPFCSERCKTGDLGAWASESYRIPTRADEPDPSTLPDEPEEGTRQ